MALISQPQATCDPQPARDGSLVWQSQARLRALETILDQR